MYRDFAYVYDELMKDVDYDAWVDFIEKVFQTYQVRPARIVDLACGTGNITSRLASRGYMLTGVDISNEMLGIAREKSRKQGLFLQYINQDIRELQLHGLVDVIVCMCDGVNYILDDTDLKQVFERVYQYLRPGGLFLFDISSHYKLSEILANNLMAETEGDVNLVWFNNFDEKTNILQMDLTFFVRQGDLFKRFYETHFQRAYKNNEIIDLLRQVGFNIDKVCADFSLDPPSKDSERIFFCSVK